MIIVIDNANNKFLKNLSTYLIILKSNHQLPKHLINLVEIMEDIEDNLLCSKVMLSIKIWRLDSHIIWHVIRLTSILNIIIFEWPSILYIGVQLLQILWLWQVHSNKTETNQGYHCFTFEPRVSLFYIRLLLFIAVQMNKWSHT